MSSTPELEAAAESIGLSIGAILRHTDKTVLAAGSLGGVPAAVKYLIDPQPFWTAKWRHEVEVYQILADLPPPIRVPRLLYSDHDRLLVLEWLDGRRLDDERYPQRTLTQEEIEAAIGCVNALNQWAGPVTRLSPTFDYAERLSRYHAKGYLTDNDLRALQRLLARSEEPNQINHGDPLASNILIDPTGEAALLDWEFTGLFLPGFDLAMLHSQLGAWTPAVRERVETIVMTTGTENAFAVNLAMVLTRELRIHHELTPGPLRELRMPIIEAAWAAARERIHRLTARSTQ